MGGRGEVVRVVVEGWGGEGGWKGGGGRGIVKEKKLSFSQLLNCKCIDN